MATTGELRTIIEELELIDAGDAASYLEDDEEHSSSEAESDNITSTLASCLEYIASENQCKVSH